MPFFILTLSKNNKRAIPINCSTLSLKVLGFYSPRFRVIWCICEAREANLGTRHLLQKKMGPYLALRV